MNYDKLFQQSRNVHSEALKTFKMLVSSASPMVPTRVAHLDPTKGLTVYRATKLHCQLALTCRKSLPKTIFQNSPVNGKASNKEDFLQSRCVKNSTKTCFPAMLSFFKLKNVLCSSGPAMEYQIL